MESNLAKAILVATVCLVTNTHGALAQSAPTCPSQRSLESKISRQDDKVERAQDRVEKYDATTDSRRLSYESRAANYATRRQTYITNYQKNCYLSGFLAGQNIGKCISTNQNNASKMKYKRDGVLALLSSYISKRAAGRTAKVAKVDREIAKRDALIQLFNTCYPVGGP